MKFTTSYYHNGSYWAIELDADNWKDAEVRCEKLNLRLDGEIMAKLPAYCDCGFCWLPRLICWIRNLFRKWSRL